MKKRRKFIYIDIFAGCGGMSLGLFKAGWLGLFAIEKNKMAFQTLKHNLISNMNHYEWPSWLPVSNHNIRTVLKKYRKRLRSLKGQVQLVVGGPPCQGFSFAGRRNKDDHRNKMIDSYIKFIEYVKPKILFFENVKGFTVGFKHKDSRGEAHSEYVLEELKKIGYKVHGEILDFSEFGVPQTRKRFILVGVLTGDPKSFFKRMVQRKANFLKRKSLPRKISVKQAISDLERRHGEEESIDFKSFKEGLYSKNQTNYQKLMRKGSKNSKPDSHRFPNHDKKITTRFEYILDNCERNLSICKKIREKFKLKKRCITPLAENKACPTLTTLPDDYIHYKEPRILTVREYARIQSFDDWFEFRGNYTTGGKLRMKDVPRYSQVGNAIPPLFGEQSGGVFKEMLS